MKRTSTIIMAAAILSLIITSFAVAADKPQFELKWYGFFKLDGAYDRNMTSHGNFVVWVPQPEFNGKDEQFNMTANETRFGFDAIATGYKNIKVTGKLEFDLYASVADPALSESNAFVQLRHAYFTVESGPFRILGGQSYDLISPLNPPTLNYAALWGAGNIGYRRPQISALYNFKAGTMDMTMAGGFFRTIGTDLTPTFSLALGETADGVDDGTDAGIPSFQMLIDARQTFASGGSFRAGISGLTGRLNAETTLGNSQRYSTWALAAHLQIAPAPEYGIAAEFYRGSNLGSYMGSILLNSEVRGLRDAGGWLSGWVQLTPRWQVNAGYGVDDPNNNDITSGRSRNSVVFGNVKYALFPQATIGLELSDWRTDYKDSEAARDFRTQTSFILNF